MSKKIKLKIAATAETAEHLKSLLTKVAASNVRMSDAETAIFHWLMEQSRAIRQAATQSVSSGEWLDTLAMPKQVIPS